jgi:hypothetical protein
MLEFDLQSCHTLNLSSAVHVIVKLANCTVFPMTFCSTHYQLKCIISWSCSKNGQYLLEKIVEVASNKVSLPVHL